MVLRGRFLSLRGEPWEFVVPLVMTAFLLLYGLVPLFGGDQVGLVGASLAGTHRAQARCCMPTTRTPLHELDR